MQDELDIAVGDYLNGVPRHGKEEHVRRIEAFREALEINVKDICAEGAERWAASYHLELCGPFATCYDEECDFQLCRWRSHYQRIS